MAKKSTRLEALHNIFEENGISPDTIELNDSLIMDIKKHAEAVPDYRHPSYTKHLPGDIIMIVFFAVLGNADEWGEIESFAKRKEKWLRKYLELPFGIPTDDTYRVVMGNINTEHFYQVTVQLLLHTIEGIVSLSEKNVDIHKKSIVSVDGKESRGSKRKSGEQGEVRALQTLNVYFAQKQDKRHIWLREVTEATLNPDTAVPGSVLSLPLPPLFYCRQTDRPLPPS